MKWLHFEALLSFALMIITFCFVSSSYDVRNCFFFGGVTVDAFSLIDNQKFAACLWTCKCFSEVSVLLSVMIDDLAVNLACVVEQIKI